MSRQVSTLVCAVAALLTPVAALRSTATKNVVKVDSTPQPVGSSRRRAGFGRTFTRTANGNKTPVKYEHKRGELVTFSFTNSAKSKKLGVCDSSTDAVLVHRGSYGTVRAQFSSKGKPWYTVELENETGDKQECVDVKGKHLEAVAPMVDEWVQFQFSAGASREFPLEGSSNGSALFFPVHTNGFGLITKQYKRSSDSLGYSYNVRLFEKGSEVVVTNVSESDIVRFNFIGHRTKELLQNEATRLKYEGKPRNITNYFINELKIPFPNKAKKLYRAAMQEHEQKFFNNALKTTQLAEKDILPEGTAVIMKQGTYDVREGGTHTLLGQTKGVIVGETRVPNLMYTVEFECEEDGLVYIEVPGVEKAKEKDNSNPDRSHLHPYFAYTCLPKDTIVLVGQGRYVVYGTTTTQVLAERKGTVSGHIDYIEGQGSNGTGFMRMSYRVLVEATDYNGKTFDREIVVDKLKGVWSKSSACFELHQVRTEEVWKEAADAKRQQNVANLQKTCTKAQAVQESDSHQVYDGELAIKELETQLTSITEELEKEVQKQNELKKSDQQVNYTECGRLQQKQRLLKTQLDQKKLEQKADVTTEHSNGMFDSSDDSSARSETSSSSGYTDDSSRSSVSSVATSASTSSTTEEAAHVLDGQHILEKDSDSGIILNENWLSDRVDSVMKIPRTSENDNISTPSIQQHILATDNNSAVTVTEHWLSDRVDSVMRIPHNSENDNISTPSIQPHILEKDTSSAVAVTEHWLSDRVDSVMKIEKSSV